MYPFKKYLEKFSINFQASFLILNLAPKTADKILQNVERSNYLDLNLRTCILCSNDIESDQNVFLHDEEKLKKNLIAI